MIDCCSSMLSRFINGILRRRPGMLGLDHLTGGTLSSGHRLLVHFQPATGGTFWVATEVTESANDVVAVLVYEQTAVLTYEAVTTAHTRKYGEEPAADA